jgi:hypothetical protein
MVNRCVDLNTFAKFRNTLKPRYSSEALKGEYSFKFFENMVPRVISVPGSKEVIATLRKMHNKDLS